MGMYRDINKNLAILKNVHNIDENSDLKILQADSVDAVVIYFGTVCNSTIVDFARERISEVTNIEDEMIYYCDEYSFCVSKVDDIHEVKNSLVTGVVCIVSGLNFGIRITPNVTKIINKNIEKNVEHNVSGLRCIYRNPNMIYNKVVANCQHELNIGLCYVHKNNTSDIDKIKSKISECDVFFGENKIIYKALGKKWYNIKKARNYKTIIKNITDGNVVIFVDTIDKAYIIKN